MSFSLFQGSHTSRLQLSDWESRHENCPMTRLADSDIRGYNLWSDFHKGVKPTNRHTNYNTSRAAQAKNPPVNPIFHPQWHPLLPWHVSDDEVCWTVSLSPACDGWDKPGSACSQTQSQKHVRRLKIYSLQSFLNVRQFIVSFEKEWNGFKLEEWANQPLGII